MKKIWSFLILLIFLMLPQVNAEDKVLSAGISIEEVPKALFGTWRITAKLEETNSPGTFKPQSADIWNLSRCGDVLMLSNPFTGANAELSIHSAEGNLVIFSKKAPYDNKILIDTVSIRIDKTNFSGINTLTLDSYSLIDNHLLKSEFARYVINGEKVSGDNALSD